MTDNTLQLGGKTLPFRRTLGAMKRFDSKYDGEISVLEMGVKPMKTHHLIDLMYFFIDAGYRSLGQQSDITVEWIEDNVDMTDLAEITAVLTGKPSQRDEPYEPNEEKKSYKGGE
jgi:hypothetical protein